jgi:hypothetical protein
MGQADQATMAALVAGQRYYPFGEPAFYVKGDDLIARKTCPVAGVNYEVTVTGGDYMRWKNGALVQNAFPNLTPDQREFLMTGATPAQWREMFGRADTTCPACDAD